MGDKIELVSYTQLNPAISFCDIEDLPSDISLLRNGIGTEQENLIEYAGRVCYLSTARMGTAPNFIVARVREGHEDIIEHVVVTLRVPKHYMPYLFRNFNRHFEVTTEGQEEEFTGNWIVSGNVRVWLDIFRQGMLWEAIPILKAIAPSVFAEFDKFRVFELDYYARYYCDDLIPMSNPPQTVSLLAFSQPQFGDKETRLNHGSATFLFEGISRACTHQLVRHRLASFSQESQRYVQYGNLDHNLSPKVPRLPKAKEEKRHGLCKFSLDQERFIAKLYNDGFNGENLSEAYDVDPVTIRDIVIRNGVEYRDVRTSRSIHINTTFFDTIDTPIKAQVLGLIYADGNVAQRDGVISHASISQHSDYKEWLKRLGKLWGGNVISSGRENGKVLTIPGKLLSESLVSHGVMPAKAECLNHQSCQEN